mmetsp:Transcript_2895/g.6421  ORF Transcript_2895/g.6421 Transcript_2895/m.6421 type:complete len:229 (+) Transcript_2895:1313-1999(+)
MTESFTTSRKYNSPKNLMWPTYALRISIEWYWIDSSSIDVPSGLFVARAILSAVSVSNCPWHCSSSSFLKGLNSLLIMEHSWAYMGPKCCSVWALSINMDIISFRALSSLTRLVSSTNFFVNRSIVVQEILFRIRRALVAASSVPSSVFFSADAKFVDDGEFFIAFDFHLVSSFTSNGLHASRGGAVSLFFDFAFEFFETSPNSITFIELWLMISARFSSVHWHSGCG